MSKKRVIVFAIIIAAVVPMIVVAGYIPVFGKLIAKSDLEAYTGDTVSVRYSLYNGHYYGVDPKGNKYSYYLNNNTIFDEAFNNQIQKQFDKQYQDYLDTLPFDSVALPEHIDIYTRIDANDHSKLYLKIYLLSAKESEHLNEKESRERMREILESICSHIDFNITAIQYGYVNLDGKYQAIYDNGKGPITQSHWTDHIKKYSDDEPFPVLPE